MFTLYYFEGPGYEIFPLRTRLNDIFTYQAQHAVNKYPDLADLGIELDDLSFEFDDGSHDLVHILDAWRGRRTFGTAVLSVKTSAPTPAGSCGTVSGPWP